MKKDKNGLPVTTNSDEVILAVDHFVDQIMSSGTDAMPILDAATANPDNLLLQCYAAIFYLYAQEDKYTAKATSILKNSEYLLKQSNQREQLFYQAITAWEKLNYELAITLLIAITEIWPRDCLAAKIAEWLFYCTGQRYQAKRFLRMCENMAKQNKNNNHFMAIHSFALELSGKIEEAYKLAMQAIDIQKLTPWAHHTLTHVYLMTGKFDQGILVLEEFKPLWKNILQPLRCHNTWHIALLYLGLLNKEKAENIFHNDIWGFQPESILEQIDAISLLWRMEMAGMPQDKKWLDIVSHLSNHPLDHYMPFNNAHLIYALARVNDKKRIAEVMQELKSYAKSQVGETHKLWHDIATPLLQGCVAFAEQDYQRATTLLDPIMAGDVFAVGGSDAQDELFVQTYYVGLVKSGQLNKAKNYFNTYLSHYENSPLANYWLSADK